MSRYIGSIFAKSRRLGFSLLENNKEFSKGKKRTAAPGQHGARRRKLSGYGTQLVEKQKLRFMYGISEKQFRRLFKIAKNMKGSNALNLLIVLESRLDNMVFRMGFAPTRRSARQLVNHGHILVNEKKCNIPSYILNVNDTVSVCQQSLNLPIVKNTQLIKPVDFVQIDNSNKVGKYVRHPKREELNQDVNETYVVE